MGASEAPGAERVVEGEAGALGAGGEPRRVPGRDNH